MKDSPYPLVLVPLPSNPEELTEERMDHIVEQIMQGLLGDSYKPPSDDQPAN